MITRPLLQKGAHFYTPQTKYTEKSKLLRLASHMLPIRQELKQSVPPALVVWGLDKGD